MWPFFIAILFVVVVVLIMLIFYVAPELTGVVIGPTGSTGPTDYEEFETTAQFFDDTTSVVSDLSITMVRQGHQVTITIPGFSFDDAAVPRTGQIKALEVVPENMRPTDLQNEMVSTFSSARKIGMLTVNTSGDVIFSVNAQVNNFITGDEWAAASNAAGNASISYTTL
jgi:hypothetical protein